MQFGPVDKTLRYILYDLREGPTLSSIHLPRDDDENPVLLRVTAEQFADIWYEMQEMCKDEGESWLSTVLIRPEDAIENKTDLEIDGIYILIAHVQFVLSYPPYDFLLAMRSMKKLVYH